MISLQDYARNWRRQLYPPINIIKGQKTINLFPAIELNWICFERITLEDLDPKNISIFYVSDHCFWIGRTEFNEITREVKGDLYFINHTIKTHLEKQLISQGSDVSVYKLLLA